MDFGAHVIGGSGMGRYSSATLPDTTVHPNGTLALLKDYGSLASVELHPSKKLDLFGYAGEANTHKERCT